MNTPSTTESWNEQKGKLKQKFAALTDNNLLFAEVKNNEMMGRLQLTLGKTPDELRSIIAAL
ncbi:MAG: CsbD family protein [Bacteroidia bacterium]